MRFLHSIFLVFALLGFLGTWGTLTWTGSTWTMIKSALDGKLPHHRPMRTKYTGLPRVDFLFSMLVAFFDGVSNRSHLASYHIMIDICSMLQSSAIWVLIECQKGGNKPRQLVVAAMYGTLWTIFAASVMVPIWCFWQASSLSTTGRSASIRLPKPHPRALFVPLTLGALIPLVPLLPTILTNDIEIQQTWIALFQLMPMTLVAVHYIANLILGHPYLRNQSTYSGYLLSVYLLSGVYSSVAHLYVVSELVASTDSEFTFGRVYLPQAGFVTSSGSDRMIEGAHLFLQYDWIVLSLTGMFFSYILLEGRTKTLTLFGKDQKSLARQICLIATCVGATLAVGPGGSISFAYAAREYLEGEAACVLKHK